MDEKEQVVRLAEILREEVDITSKTYTENTKVMCETIKKLQKWNSILVFGIVTILLVFMILLCLL